MFEDLQQEMGLTYLFIAHDLSAVSYTHLVDNIMMRITDVLYTIPDILLIILLGMALKDPLDKLSTQPVSYTHLDVYKRQVHLPHLGRRLLPVHQVLPH